MFTHGVVGFLLVAVCFGYPHPQFVPVPIVPGFQFPVGFGQPGFGATNFASRFGDGSTGTFSSVSSSSGPFGGGTTITTSDVKEKCDFIQILQCEYFFRDPEGFTLALAMILVILHSIIKVVSLQ
jgi:hypothetical protein